MKKRLIVVLAVLATVVGMAFAATTVHQYAECNHYCTDGGTIVDAANVGGSGTKKKYICTDKYSRKGLCPACNQKKGMCNYLEAAGKNGNGQAAIDYLNNGCNE